MSARRLEPRRRRGTLRQRRRKERRRTRRDAGAPKRADWRRVGLMPIEPPKLSWWPLRWARDAMGRLVAIGGAS